MPGKPGKPIARGKSSEIIKLNERVVIKKLRSDATRKNLRKEFAILKLLEPYGIAPRAYKLVNDSELWMEYIPGRTLKELLSSNLPEEHKTKLLIKLIHRAAILDLLGISHNQLHIGKNVLVTPNGEVYIVDFEKASLNSPSARNVGQVLGYYVAPRVSREVFKRLQELARSWKLLVKEIRSLHGKQDPGLSEPEHEIG